MYKKKQVMEFNKIDPIEFNINIDNEQIKQVHDFTHLGNNTTKNGCSKMKI